MSKNRNCLVCSQAASGGFLEFSQSKFGVPLCLKDQQWLVDLEPICEPEFIRLFFEFRSRGVKVALENDKASGICRIRMPMAGISVVLDFSLLPQSLQEGFLETRKSYSRQNGKVEVEIPVAEAFLKTARRTKRTVELLLDLLEGEPIEANKNPLPYTYRLPSER